jgi:hypothetical protein
MKVSIISSLYRTDSHIEKWSKTISNTIDKLCNLGVDIELIAVANDPTEKEKRFLNNLKSKQWFKLVEVPRESIYASWNRGVANSNGDICTFWNVDDIRFSKAILDGIHKIEKGAEVVYFPFIYLRFVKILGLSLLAKIKIFFPPKFEKVRFSREMHNGPFFMFTKKIYQDVGPFDEQYKIAGDFDWCSRASIKTDFTRSKVIAGIFTNDGTTLSGSKSQRHVEENKMILSKTLKKK